MRSCCNLLAYPTQGGVWLVIWTNPPPNGWHYTLRLRNPKLNLLCHWNPRWGVDLTGTAYKEWEYKFPVIYTPSKPWWGFDRMRSLKKSDPIKCHFSSQRPVTEHPVVFQFARSLPKLVASINSSCASKLAKHRHSWHHASPLGRLDL